MTGLVGGGRIKKNALRIETYGTLDELSSAIGVARAALRPHLAEEPRAVALDDWLAWTQDKLFDLGAELATLPKDRRDNGPAVRSGDAQALERAMDAAQAELSVLANFIHPGGSIPGAQLHFARTICRRAERLLVGLIDSEETAMGDGLIYVNRLSDALFVWARWINDALHVPEHRWNQTSRPPQA